MVVINACLAGCVAKCPDITERELVFLSRFHSLDKRRREAFLAMAPEGDLGALPPCADEQQEL